MTELSKVLDEMQSELDQLTSERSLRHLMETNSQAATLAVMVALGTVALWRQIEKHGLADHLLNIPELVAGLRRNVAELRAGSVQIAAGRMDA